MYRRFENFEGTEPQFAGLSEMPAQQTGAIVTSEGPAFAHTTGRTCNPLRISTEPDFRICEGAFRVLLSAHPFDQLPVRVLRSVAQVGEAEKGALPW